MANSKQSLRFKRKVARNNLQCGQALKGLTKVHLHHSDIEIIVCRRHISSFSIISKQDGDKNIGYASLRIDQPYWCILFIFCYLNINQQWF